MGEKEEKVAQDRSIHVGGNVIASPLNAGDQENVNIDVDTGGINVTTTKIAIDKTSLEKMPQEYAKSLQEFSDKVNQQLEKSDVPPEKVATLQKSANDLAKEVVDVKPEKEIDFDKETSLRSKFSNLAESLVSASPKIAETLISMTPLAPFSKLVGKAFEEMVASKLKKTTEKPTENKT